jgi:hypothetical protein
MWQIKSPAQLTSCAGEASVGDAFEETPRCRVVAPLTGGVLPRRPYHAIHGNEIAPTVN